MLKRWVSSARGGGGGVAAPRALLSTTAPSSSRPENVGILAMETYVANRCVTQEALEKADGVSAGKYTVGGFGSCRYCARACRHAARPCNLCRQPTPPSPLLRQASASGTWRS